MKRAKFPAQSEGSGKTVIIEEGEEDGQVPQGIIRKEGQIDSNVIEEEDGWSLEDEAKEEGSTISEADTLRLIDRLQEDLNEERIRRRQLGSQLDDIKEYYTEALTRSEEELQEETRRRTDAQRELGVMLELNKETKARAAAERKAEEMKRAKEKIERERRGTVAGEGSRPQARTLTQALVEGGQARGSAVVTQKASAPNTNEEKRPPAIATIFSQAAETPGTGADPATTAITDLLQRLAM